MKKILISFLFLLMASTGAMAQHYCIIDSKYLLDKMSDYKDAQNKLDNISKAWQDEIDNRMAEVERMYKADAFRRHAQ